MDKNIINWSLDLLSKPRIKFDYLEQSRYSTEYIRLSKLLNSTVSRQLIWHVVNQTDSPPQCKCGKILKWNQDKHQYRDFCSKKCTALYTRDKIKSTNLKKYGVDHYSKTTEYLDKVKNTSLEKFSKEHYSQTAEFKQRTIATNQLNLGVNYPAQSLQIKEKMKATYVERYGVDNPGKSKKVQEKLQETNLKRYGVKNPLKSAEIKEKVKNTNIEKYGVENPRQNSKISNKIRESRLKNRHSTIVYNLLHNPAWLEDQNKKGKSVGEIAKDLDISSSQLCKYFNRYGIEITKHFRSAMEADLCNRLHQLSINYKCNVRNIINPYEIDIWLPDYNLGIELNGAYYHSELHGKDSNYHLAKTLAAESKSIQLLQFFDWEYFNNSDLIIDKISHLTNANKKIGARQLKIELLSNKIANNFFELNHLQGPCKSSVSLGLIDNSGQMLSAASFGNSRYNKRYNHELLRFACFSGTAVVGAASRLLKYYMENYIKPNESIISYCNRRWSTGNLYQKLGFKLDHISKPGYYYVTNSGKYVGNRQLWQKHMLSKKLSIFDPTLTEWENMQANGYTRVWDCGNLVYTMTK